MCRDEHFWQLRVWLVAYEESLSQVWLSAYPTTVPTIARNELQNHENHNKWTYDSQFSLQKFPLLILATMQVERYVELHNEILRASLTIVVPRLRLFAMTLLPISWSSLSKLSGFRVTLQLRKLLFLLGSWYDRTGVDV
jgi:hypothetical protein